MRRLSLRSGRRGLVAGGAAAVLAAFMEARAQSVSSPGGNAGIGGLPTIESFSSSIVGNGIVDDSTAVQAAHDAAYAAGIREVYCSRQYNAPAASNLGNVIFRGPGRLIGTYRKQVIPDGARAAAPFFVRGDINPSRDLKQFSRALNPVVTIVGDSTGVGGNARTLMDFLTPRLQEALEKANRGRTISFVNRSIAGTSWVEAAAANLNGFTVPSWYTSTANPWLNTYVQPLAPDLLIWNFGTNTPGETRYFRIAAAVAIVNAWAKVPSQIFCTNNPRAIGGPADAGLTLATTLSIRDIAAANIRNFARITPGGLLDIHRMGVMCRDGYDPCDNRILASTVNNLAVANGPYTLPETVDFDLVFTIDNTGSALFAGGGGMDFSVIYGGFHSVINAAATGPRIRLFRSSSALSTQIIDNGGVVWQGTVATGVALGATLYTFEIAKRGGWVRLLCNGTVCFESQIVDGGGLIMPQIGFTGPFTIVSYMPSTPASLYIPMLTDVEMFGLAADGTDGNGVNHPANLTHQTITGPVIEAANLTMIPGPIDQSLTAAGAIDLRATNVKLTGPASSTYAITLAAPGALNPGQLMIIEMIATTGTNAVTMALTNCSGGTASTSCSWSAAGHKLVLMAASSKWEIIKQDGVTLT
jgi:hypothetical protein